MSVTHPTPSFSKSVLESSVVDRFRQMVKKHPHRIAVDDGTRQIAYEDLWKDARRLASWILETRFRSDTSPIALMLDHDASLVTGILGTLMAGHPYVALDRAFPAIMVRQILGDSGARAVVTSDPWAEAWNTLPDLHILDIEALPPAPGNGSEARQSHSGDPFCISYTSGSEGLPKGILRNHRCLLHAIRNYTRCLEITPDDRLLLLTSASFAASLSPLFGALLNGACVLPFDFRSCGLQTLIRRLNEDTITILQTVPSLFRLLARSLEGTNHFPRLRLIKLGGEPMFASDVELFRNRFHQDCILVNGLGMTETGSNLCHFRIDRNTRIDGTMVPVGRPLEDEEITLLDEAGQSVAPGEIGEITVTSPYLTSGYWRDPEQTRTRFQPVEDGRGAVRFRTGDLGRWRKDGCLEHLGRKDNQVKIRGFRVDPLAVEAALNRLEIVDQAIVEPYSPETGEFRLMGFVLPAMSSPPDARTLRQELSRNLPEYMIPSEFVLLEAIPLTPNGKADRRALQQMAADRLATPSATSAEESETLESILTGLWKKALRVPCVREDESFFDLGGNSLSAMELVDDLCRTLAVNLPASVVFEAPTVEAMAAALRDPSRCVAWSTVLPLTPTGSRPPLFCFPQGGGDGLIYRDLARYLESDQPIYCLRPGLPGSDNRSRGTLEEEVASLINDLRSFQLKGPFYLCGISYGGMAAWETARQLRALGETVGRLILIDTYGPGLVTERLRYIRGPWRHAYVLFQKFRLHGQVLRYLPHARRRVYLTSKIRHRMESYRLDDESPKPDSAVYRERLFANHQATYEHYQPRKLDCPVALVRAEIQFSPKAARDRSLGWRGMTSSPIDVLTVPGFHTLLLYEPFIRFTGSAIRDLLNIEVGVGARSKCTQG